MRTLLIFYFGMVLLQIQPSVQVHLPGIFAGLDNITLPPELNLCVRHHVIEQWREPYPAQLGELYKLWCSSYKELAECISAGVKEDDDSVEYLHMVFDAAQMKKRGAKLCQQLEDARYTLVCFEDSKQFQPISCDESFISSLENVTDFGTACRKSVDLFSCYREHFLRRRCKLMEVLVLYDMLMVHQSDRCSYVIDTVDDVCRGIAESLYPGIFLPTSYCKEKYRLKIECFQRLSDTSQHPKDKRISMEINPERYINYTEKYCEEVWGFDFSCLGSQYVACQTTLQEANLEQEATLSKNGFLPEEKICKKYQNYENCLESAQSLCPEKTQKIAYYAMCASMPSSCICSLEGMLPQTPLLMPSTDRMMIDTNMTILTSTWTGPTVFSVERRTNSRLSDTTTTQSVKQKSVTLPLQQTTLMVVKTGFAKMSSAINIHLDVNIIKAFIIVYGFSICRLF